jgi:hypothetical protein
MLNIGRGSDGPKSVAGIVCGSDNPTTMAVWLGDDGAERFRCWRCGG